MSVLDPTDAVLARAEGDFPITEEWLQSLGFTQTGYDVQSYRVYGYSEKSHSQVLILIWRFCEGWQILYKIADGVESMIHQAQTRKQVKAVIDVFYECLG